MTTARSRSALLALCLPALAVAGLWATLGRSRSPSDSGNVVLTGKPARILDKLYSLGEVFPATLYLLEAEDSLVLVDTGFDNQWEQVRERVQSLGLDPARIGHVLITHMHLDHCMAAARIREETGARVYAGAGDAAELERGASWERLMTILQPPEGWQVPPMHIDHVLQGGEVLPIPGLRIQALHTPGHSPGSICYLLETEGRHVLFSGDTVMSVAAEDGTYPAALHPRFGGDADAYLASVRKLMGIRVDVLLPGHPGFDRAGGGDPPSPFMTPEQWRGRLQGMLDALERIRRGFQEDGRNFLDERPRRLHPGLLYLGLLGTTAAYALETGDGVVLVDPGPERAGALLWERLKDLGYGPEQVQAVLVTRNAPELTGLLPEILLAANRPALYCGRDEVPLLGGPGTVHGVQDGQVLHLGDLAVQALAVPGYSRGGTAWRVELAGKQLLFTGDAAVPATTVERGPRPAPTYPSDYAASLKRLAGLRVDMWLPPHPYKAQNANLYDDQWTTIIRDNLRALENQAGGDRQPW